MGFSQGREKVAQLFRQFTGPVPPCPCPVRNCRPGPWRRGCTWSAGRVWIATDAATGISLRAHQRLTLLFRWDGQKLHCFHIHISNPYEEMKEGGRGLPTPDGPAVLLYLQEQIEAQKQQIAQQTALLERLSFEDSLTGTFNRNKYNQLLERGWDHHLASWGWPALT